MILGVEASGGTRLVVDLASGGQAPCARVCLGRL